MSSKRGIRRRHQRNACQGKHPHATKMAADFHVGELYAAGKAKPDTLQSYRCEHCPCFHVGHRRGSKAIA